MCLLNPITLSGLFHSLCELIFFGRFDVFCLFVFFFLQTEQAQLRVMETETLTPGVTIPCVLQLHLTIPQLPVRSNYSCVFLDLNWSSPAEFWYFGARCLTPSFKRLGMSLGTEGRQGYHHRSLRCVVLVITGKLGLYGLRHVTSLFSVYLKFSL